MDIQKAFDLAFETKIYWCGQGYRHLDSVLYMCHAMEKMMSSEMIDFRDYDKFTTEIMDYVYPFRTLRKRLAAAGLPHHHKDLAAIYRNWSDRPKLPPCDPTWDHKLHLPIPPCS